MYKLKKEYKGQNVTVYTPDKKVIKLENADQKEFEKAIKIKGNEKFIENDNKVEKKIEKKVEKKIEPFKKVVKK